MKLESVRIENFRSYENQTINLDNYTCFVGPNGAGKSTVFNALNIFFRQYKDSKTDLSKLSESDFHHKDTSKDIRITVTFIELSDQAKNDLSDYVRQGKLIITAVASYDSVTKRAEVKQYGNRLAMAEFRSFFEADKNNVKASELKDIYNSFQETYTDLPKATSKALMIEGLQSFEASHPEKCVLIPSEDQFYGATRGTSRLAPHIQWVFVSASKDATEEGDESKTSALGQLLARTVRSAVNFDEKVSDLLKNTRDQYQTLLDNEQGSLNEISKSLQNRLSGWAHPNITANVAWKHDLDKSVRIEEPFAYIKIGERGFEGDLSRFGHGLQRSYMLALLQELALVDDASAPTLIMGIEEPELYQHPPQARYLAETLIDLSDNGAQLLLCTHNPLFIPGDSFDKIRIVRENNTPSQTFVTSVTYAKLAEQLNLYGDKHTKESGIVARLYPSLNPVMNEMFFCKILILVEGYEDVAYITSYLILMGVLTEFRKHGCHIVPVEGKSRLLKPLTLAKLLSIPTFVVFDGDTDKENEVKPDRREKEVNLHKKDNRAKLDVQGHNALSEWPNEHLFQHNLVCWKHNLTSIVKEELGANYNVYRDKAFLHYGNTSELEKHPLAIAKCLEFAWSGGAQSSSLISLVSKILQFASNQNSHKTNVTKVNISNAEEESFTTLL